MTDCSGGELVTPARYIGQKHHLLPSAQPVERALGRSPMVGRRGLWKSKCNILLIYPKVCFHLDIIKQCHDNVNVTTCSLTISTGSHSHLLNVGVVLQCLRRGSGEFDWQQIVHHVGMVYVKYHGSTFVWLIQKTSCLFNCKLTRNVTHCCKVESVKKKTTFDLNTWTRFRPVSGWKLPA